MDAERSFRRRRSSSSARKSTLFIAPPSQRVAVFAQLDSAHRELAQWATQRRHNVKQDARLVNQAEKLARSTRSSQRIRSVLVERCGLTLALVAVAAISLLLVAHPTLADDSASATNGGPTTAAASSNEAARQQLVADKAALEAELDSILQQQELGQQETNSKLLSEAIISRLMLGNLSEIAGARSDEASAVAQSGEPLDMAAGPAAAIAELVDGGETSPLTGREHVPLRQLLTYLRNYQAAMTNDGQAYGQYPVLPAEQAATIKRASMRMSNYLRQQAQHQHNNQRQLNGYGRVNSFDFGLGKRPDASVSGNILRLGDSAGAGGHMAAVSGSGLGKRPAAHRYDFGLGKRVASPAYPRYDFGLGKRAPSRIRYDFGLGK